MSVYESKDAYVKSGQLPYILDNIKWTTDYYIKCHPSPNVYYYRLAMPKRPCMVGLSEVMQMERPAYKLDTSNPGSTVVAETAAALASSSIIFRDTDPGYAATCLSHAKDLLLLRTLQEVMQDIKQQKVFILPIVDSMMNLHGLLCGCILLLRIPIPDKAESYEPNWERELGSDTIKYRWAHCWDNKLFGAMLL